MYNEKFISEITSVTAASKAVTQEDGTKSQQGYTKLTVESASIDYDQMGELNPYVSATLLNVQPIPFNSVTFTDHIKECNLKLTFYTVSEGLHENESEQELDSYSVDLVKLVVKVKDNIPVLAFHFEVRDGNIDQLHNCIKRKINLKIWKV